jgi:hypothetical protein
VTTCDDDETQCTVTPTCDDDDDADTLANLYECASAVPRRRRRCCAAASHATTARRPRHLLQTPAVASRQTPLTTPRHQHARAHVLWTMVLASVLVTVLMPERRGQV